MAKATVMLTLGEGVDLVIDANDRLCVRKRCGSKLDDYVEIVLGNATHGRLEELQGLIGRLKCFCVGKPA